MQNQVTLFSIIVETFSNTSVLPISHEPKCRPSLPGLDCLPSYGDLTIWGLPKKSETSSVQTEDVNYPLLREEVGSQHHPTSLRPLSIHIQNWPSFSPVLTWINYINVQSFAQFQTQNHPALVYPRLLTPTPSWSTPCPLHSTALLLFKSICHQDLILFCQNFHSSS